MLADCKSTNEMRNRVSVRSQAARARADAAREAYSTAMNAFAELNGEKPHKHRDA